MAIMIIAIFGFVLPALFSAASDIAVILGVLVIILGVYAIYVFSKHIFLDIRKRVGALNPENKL